MGKVHDGIDTKLAAWIGRQRMFFVGTAPSGDDGHVNVSPKGPIESLRILDPRTVAYLDVIGSGAETIAHLRDNGRITLMFCAFQGPPNIVRLHGTGRAVAVTDPEFAKLLTLFDAAPETHGARSIIDVRVDRISDSCGYAVPLMSYEGDRDLLTRSHARRDEAALAEYRRVKNAVSIDGLPVFG
jgi:hypothetical protein